MHLSAPPRKRLRTKTAPAGAQPNSTQVPLTTVDDWAKDEDPAARRSFWLVTMPHPQSATSADGFPLRAPGDFTKQGAFEALADSCKKPDYLNAKSHSRLMLLV